MVEESELSENALVLFAFQFTGQGIRLEDIRGTMFSSLILLACDFE